MNTKNVASRLLHAVAMFALVEFVVVFFMLMMFRMDIIVDLFELFGGIILILLLGVIIFVAGYITCLVPSKKIISKLVAQLQKLSADKKNLLSEKSRRIELEKKNNALTEKVAELKKQIDAAGIMKTVGSLPTEPSGKKTSKKS